jgi:CheY-like chemotaxis protein
MKRSRGAQTASVSPRAARLGDARLDGAEARRAWPRCGCRSSSSPRTSANTRAQRADEVGIDAVLHKPVSPSTLHDAVSTCFSRGRERRGGRRRRALPGGKRVLLVEDNEINREVARELLRSPASRRRAHNGYEALEQLAAERSTPC